MEKEWIAIDKETPEKEIQVELLLNDGNSICIDNLFYTGVDGAGHKFTNQEVSNPIFYDTVTHWRYRG